MGVGIFGVESDHFIEVFDCLFVEANHLVGLGPFVDESYVSADLVYTVSEREDGLLKLFNSAIGQSNVVVDITFMGEVRSILQCKLQKFDTLFVLLSCKVSKSLSLQEKGIVLVKLNRSVIVFYAFFVLLHGEEALCSVH